VTRTTILAILLWALPAFAQQPNTASLTGGVTDTAGKPIAKATLLLLGGGRRLGLTPNFQPYRATTANDGTYSFAGIQPGTGRTVPLDTTISQETSPPNQ
jgi:Carboxypeptidase regulatory-like domain